VTIEEIDSFLDRLMNEAPGQDYAERLGRKWWHLEHKAGEIYGCPTCQPTFQMLASAKHDAVNIQLGKPVFDPENFLKAVAFYNEAAKKILGKELNVKGISIHATHHEPQGVTVSH
jgi:hypothetical protein